MGSTPDNLIEVLHQAHLDNSQQVYSARKQRIETLIMPVTSFVYELFLYNSIYQVDWEASFANGSVISYPSDSTEVNQQKKLEQFLRARVRKSPELIYRAFAPLLSIPTQGEWTEVEPGSRISVQAGRSFFNKIGKLQEMLRGASNPEHLAATRRLFETIEDCRYFAYLVRNSIFHGSKPLGKTYDEDQKRRLEVYDLFLKCITSLFFLVAGRKPVASDCVQLPISGMALSNTYPSNTILDQGSVLEAVNLGLMKVGDSRLIPEFSRSIPPPDIPPVEGSALFYPSAGSDLLTPIILGLPYCREFFFYDNGSARIPPPPLEKMLRRLRGVDLATSNRFQGRRWRPEGAEFVSSFDHSGVPRSLRWIKQDNKEFLNRNVRLSFYFHRGDSWGEGGSGQCWDSDLLPKLLTRMPSGESCVFLTDGEPGGLHDAVRAKSKEVRVPSLRSDTRYFYGLLSSEVF